MVIVKRLLAQGTQMKLILMSATVDVDKFVKYFDNCPRIDVPGRTFPVQTFFLEDAIEVLNFRPPPPRKTFKGNKEDSMNYVENPSAYSPQTIQALSTMSENEIPFEMVAEIVSWAYENNASTGINGSVLVFLPGWQMIVGLWKHLNESPALRGKNVEIFPLHSMVPKDEQMRCFDNLPTGQLKVILSTNIAETSVTIDDVVYVIDTCKVKLNQFNAAKHQTGFDVTWTGANNIMQRRGRAGRVQEGFCFTCCTKARFENLEPSAAPEMVRTPLHTLVLTTMQLGLGDVGKFLSQAMDPPTNESVTYSISTLQEMGAVNSGQQITSLGRILAKLPLEPRLGYALVSSCMFGVGDPIATFAATMCAQDFFICDKYNGYAAPQHKEFSEKRHSDMYACLSSFYQWSNMWNHDERNAIDFANKNALSHMVLQQVNSAKNQILELMQGMGFPEQCFVSTSVNQSRIWQRVSAMMCLALSPNVGLHNEKRKMFVNDTEIAQVQRSSVVCTKTSYIFPSPFFIFKEKVKAGGVSVRKLSMCTPLLVLLFGCDSAQYAEENSIVTVDEWLPMKMKFDSAALCSGLRKAHEMLIMRVAHDPMALCYDDQLNKFVDIVADMALPSTGEYKEFAETDSKGSYDHSFRPTSHGKGGGKAGGYSSSK